MEKKLKTALHNIGQVARVQSKHEKKINKRKYSVNQSGQTILNIFTNVHPSPRTLILGMFERERIAYINNNKITTANLYTSTKKRNLIGQ